MSRIVTSGDDWMRDMERRVGRQERRPAPASFADQLGPGITQRARAIVDWNDPATLRNGWYFTDVLSLNTPNPMMAWLGHTMVTSDGRGIQQVWSHGDPPTVLYTREFFYEGGSAVPTFSDWSTRTDPFVPTGLPITRHYSFLNPVTNPVPNTGATATAYHLSPGVAIPTGARTAEVSAHAPAHAETNAAMTWRAYVRFPGHGDVQFSNAYQHNDAYSARDLSFAASSVFDVRPYVGETLELFVIAVVDPGGNVARLGRCAWNITFIG